MATSSYTQQACRGMVFPLTFDFFNIEKITIIYYG
jgi:hypothetical protein